MLYWKW